MPNDPIKLPNRVGGKPHPEFPLPGLNPLLVKYRIGVHVATNICHVGLIQLGRLGAAMRPLMPFDDIRVDLLLVDLAGQHAHDELVHGGVLVGLLEAL